MDVYTFEYGVRKNGFYEYAVGVTPSFRGNNIYKKIHEKLYELENSLDNMRFIRISKSEIVNLREIKKLDMDMVGTIKVILINSETPSPQAKPLWGLLFHFLIWRSANVPVTAVWILSGSTPNTAPIPSISSKAM